MSVFLFIIGALLCVLGLFLVGFFIPNREFSIGSTFITTGSIAIVGGLALIGFGAVTRELRKMTKALLERPAPPPQPAARQPAPPSTRTAPPARGIARPDAVATRAPPRAEPRFDESEAQEPPPANAPTIADITAEQTRTGLFASMRGRSAAAPRFEPPQPPSRPRVPREETPAPLPEREPEPARGSENPPTTRSSSLSALAARTAARLDLPRATPEPTRVPPERIAPEPPPASTPERTAEKPPRNVFDTVWPTGSRPPTEEETFDRENEPSPESAEPAPPEILKSGVIDGMAYTLYTDGSIEAQLPQGTLRFSSIDDLRAHLEQGN
jgi:hypothetical protein